MAALCYAEDTWTRPILCGGYMGIAAPSRAYVHQMGINTNQIVETVETLLAWSGLLKGLARE